MFKHIGKIALLIFFFSACSESEKEESIPSYVLDKDKFSDVIVDFTLAESASGINILNVQGGNSDTVYAFNPLIDNNIKRETYDTSLYFYSHHPKLFKEVYELVLEKLSKLQASRK
jgi:hypothetical protein